AVTGGGTAAESLPGGVPPRRARPGRRPGRPRVPLLYGEWLRRENRRTDAREQLRTAHEMLAAMGAEAFAERAGHELLATGGIVRQPTAQPVSALSAQEAHLAPLAARGHTQPPIRAQP